MVRYWNSLRIDETAPLRADFDPSALADLAPRMFIVGTGPGLPIRLAGGLVTDLHGRGLKGQEFLGLWRDTVRPAVRRAADRALAGVEPVMLSAEGFAQTGERAGLDIVLAPLASPNGPDRLVGLYQPTSTLARLNGQPFEALTLRLSARREGLQPTFAAASSLRLAAVDGRRIA